MALAAAVCSQSEAKEVVCLGCRVLTKRSSATRETHHKSPDVIATTLYHHYILRNRSAIGSTNIVAEVQVPYSILMSFDYSVNANSHATPDYC